MTLIDANFMAHVHQLEWSWTYAARSDRKVKMINALRDSDALVSRESGPIRRSEWRMCCFWERAKWSSSTVGPEVILKYFKDIQTVRCEFPNTLFKILSFKQDVWIVWVNRIFTWIKPKSYLHTMKRLSTSLFLFDLWEKTSALYF